MYYYVSSSLPTSESKRQAKGFSGSSTCFNVISQLNVQAAFTLFEVIVCLSILSIALFFALPVTQNIRQNQQHDRVVSDIKQAVQLGRLTALSQGTDVRLVPITNSQGWSQGISLVMGEKTIKTWRWSYPHITVSWQGFQSKHALHFANVLAQQSVNGRFSVNAATGRHSVLVVNRLGRIIAA